MIDILLWAGGILFTGLFGLIGWVIGMVFSEITMIKKDVNEHKLHVANNYTTKADVREMKDEIINHLNRIEEKVDKK